jgi:RNA polymerase sigma-70 factor (ECF subfamily)
VQQAISLALTRHLTTSLARPREAGLDKRVTSDRPAGADAARDADDLIERIARVADREAFAELFRRFAPRIKSYLRRLGCETGQAEELTQETMVMVWRRATMFDRRRASASTWLFTIARNKRIDLLRRERRPEIDPTDPALVPDPAPSAEEPLLLRQRAGRLAAALAELPHEQAELIRLAYFDEHSQSAIAEARRMPLGTVKSRLRLAISRLRRSLEEGEA